MNWTEIVIEIPTKYIEEAGDIAHMASPHGFYVEDYSDMEETVLLITGMDLIDEELLRKDPEKALLHIYLQKEDNPGEALSALLELLGVAGIPYDSRVNDVDDEDWATSWKQYYHPVKVTERLVICPTWEEYTPRPEEIVLRLDPGMAFGTGTHETTRLALSLVEMAVKQGGRVLDIGCGSGILSIGALLLGAESATAVDIDPVAVKVTGENASLNGVEEKLTVYSGDFVDHVNGIFDLIVANIVADVILQITPDVQTYLAPEGLYIVSGIISPQCEEVETALKQEGFDILAKHTQADWNAYLCKTKV